MDDSLWDTVIQIHLAAGRDSVVSVFKSRMNKLHTARSWEFLGLNPLYGNNPPIKFKGECVAGENFTSDNCNRYL